MIIKALFVAAALITVVIYAPKAYRMASTYVKYAWWKVVELGARWGMW